MLPSRHGGPASGARIGADQRQGRAMQRDIFTSDHEAFRDAVHSFIAKQVAP
jgi:hypothetical protein